MSLRTQGHAAAAEVVRRAIVSGRVPHALLLVGPPGAGKTTLALDLAAGMLCLDPGPERRPCRACRACRKVESGDHPDVHRLAPEGAGEQIRIAQVHALAADLALLPLEGRARVAIVESAQRLNHDAQNALLKTLEEPGAGTCIVLCADDTAPMLPTVVSRTVRLRLGRLPLPLVTGMLLAGGMDDASRARALALASGGCPGRAITLAGEPEAVLGRGRVARTLLDLARAPAQERLAAASDLAAEGARLGAASRGDPSEAAREPRPAERRRAVQALLETWRDVGRDLAVVSWTGGPGVRDVDLLEDLVSVAKGLDRAALVRFLERLEDLVAALESYASPELVLDTLLLAWPRVSAEAA